MDREHLMVWGQNQLGFMTEETDTKKGTPSQESWASGFNLRQGILSQAVFINISTNDI